MIDKVVDISPPFSTGKTCKSTSAHHQLIDFFTLFFIFYTWHKRCDSDNKTLTDVNANNSYGEQS